MFSLFGLKMWIKSSEPSGRSNVNFSTWKNPLAWKKGRWHKFQIQPDWHSCQILKVEPNLPMQRLATFFSQNTSSFIQIYSSTSDSLAKFLHRCTYFCTNQCSFKPGWLTNLSFAFRSSSMLVIFWHSFWLCSFSSMQNPPSFFVKTLCHM